MKKWVTGGHLNVATLIRSKPQLHWVMVLLTLGMIEDICPQNMGNGKVEWIAY